MLEMTPHPRKKGIWGKLCHFRRVFTRRSKVNIHREKFSFSGVLSVIPENKMVHIENSGVEKYVPRCINMKAGKKENNGCFLGVSDLMGLFLQILLNVISHFKDNHDIGHCPRNLPGFSWEF